MTSVSVANVASELGISPRRVRQMLADGQLVGERIGRDWVVDRARIEHARRLRHLAGRPWRPASAWAVLAIAGGGGSEFSPVVRSRARHRLAERGLVELVDRLVARAERRSFYGHPAALQRLRQEQGAVRGGVSAAAVHDVDLVGGDLLEIYFPEQRLGALIERYALDDDAERPNVLIHAVDDAVWPFDAGVEFAPWPVVAVDLLESEDERARRAGRELAERHS
jgi:hypothetical protein